MSRDNVPSSIPLFDLSLVHEAIFSELISAVEKVGHGNGFINGKDVVDFESEFASYHGSAHAVALSSGTDALLVALMALGIGPGDEVITTPFTFISSAEVIVRLGARPVFADIDPESFCISAEEMISKVSSRTKAIIPVHLFGRSCSMDQILAMSEDAGVAVVEDCAQAMGTKWRSSPVGTLGDFGAFSFFPTKNLGGWGDGGMLLCSSEDKASTARAIRDHGARQRGRYELPGGNFRLDSIQAAILLRKLKHVDLWREQRLQAARIYDDLFEKSGLAGCDSAPLVLPSWGKPEEHSFGLYVIRAQNRDALAEHLASVSVGCGKYYDTPLHLQKCFLGLGHQEGDFPLAEAAARQVLALPCYAGISQSAQGLVVDEIERYYNS